MIYPTNLPFNSKPPTIIHLDLNSCFATVEQQANPLLRGKPVAVAAYPTSGGCIIAPSIEAKRLGIKLGMRVKDGKKIYPDLVILTPDPWKYRFVNRKLLTLLKNYSDQVSVKSIDEMVLDLTYSPTLKKGMQNIVKEIKQRIKKEIGEWLTVSIGIASNRFLSKAASNLHKPDGLVEINHHNFEKIYAKLPVEKLCGIKINNMVRLHRVGIFTVLEMYRASIQQLRMAFNSILGYYWYLRLRGFEVDSVDFDRKSFGQSYALSQATDNFSILAKLLCHLVEKMGIRMRRAGYLAYGIHLACQYIDYSFWHHGHCLPKKMYASSDLYKQALRILISSPVKKPVRLLSVSCFNLERELSRQLSFLPDEEKKRLLTLAIDTITNRFGDFTVFPARMMGTKEKILDRIAFGGVKELEEFVFQEPIAAASEDYFTSMTSSSLQ